MTITREKRARDLLHLGKFIVDIARLDGTCVMT
jgi:hypothetical protein